MGQIIDGKELAVKFRAQLSEEIKQKGVQPCLAVVLVGEDPASLIYVKNKEKYAKKVGISSIVYRFPVDTTEREVLCLIQKLNRDDNVHGILLQLPVPSHICAQHLIESINPIKDVDGLSPINVGHLVSGKPALIPCTPLGCMYLIHHVKKKLQGLHAVVVGRSSLVGRPLATLLLNEDCTVTQAHSRTKNLEAVCNQADILISATGVPGLITAKNVKKGAIVIDVGINRQDDGRIVGDVVFDEVLKQASFVTPVPGGVGPMTIAMLLFNTMQAFEKQRK